MIGKSAGEFTTADFTSGPAAIPVSPTQRFHPYSGFAWGDVTATSPPFNMLLRAPSNTPPGERSGVSSGGALAGTEHAWRVGLHAGVTNSEPGQARCLLGVVRLIALHCGSMTSEGSDVQRRLREEIGWVVLGVNRAYFDFAGGDELPDLEVAALDVS